MDIYCPPCKESFLSFFLSFLVLTSLYLLFVVVEVIVALDHTQSHTHTHTRQNSFGRIIGPSQRPLPDNTHPGGILTRNPSKRAAADPRLRPRGHRDRQKHFYEHNIFLIFSTVLSIYGRNYEARLDIFLYLEVIIGTFQASRNHLRTMQGRFAAI